MAASHREAVVALLRADPNLSVIDGPAPKGTAVPYVVVYVYVPNEFRNTINGPTDETNVVVITHSTAANMTGVGIVAARVRSALLDKRPAVDGFQTTRITHEAGDSPADWDDSTGVTVLSQIGQWDYTARPA